MESPLNNKSQLTTAQPEAQPSAGVAASRLVTREETIKPTFSDESDHYGEELKIARGRGGYARPLFIPHPDETKPENIAHIDWLAFTYKGDGTHEEHLSFRGILNELFSISPDLWKGTKAGWNGYKHKIMLGSFGLLAHGGKSQNKTTHIEINAHGCSLVKDWIKVYQWGISSNSILTRIDLAHDDYDGRTVNIDICKKWHEDGLFNWNGRPPKQLLYDDCDSGDGKTYKIGKRKSGKELRMYEKGKEQGDPNDPWFRVELELHDKDRVLPWDMIIKPGQYLAGGYKALNYLSEEQIKIKTTKKQKDMTYDQTVEWVRTAAGKAINVIVKENGGDLSAVFDLIVREGVPKRLEPYYCKGKDIV